MTRLFVAAWPPPAVVARLHRLVAVEPVERERRVAPENWHITLRFLGDTDPDDLVERLEAATLPVVTAVLGPEVIGFWGGQVVIPVDGVDPLAEAVGAATHDLGEPPRYDFRGHLTLARVKKPGRSALLGEPIQATFGIDEVIVVNSETRATGPVYEQIATFSTRPSTTHPGES